MSPVFGEDDVTALSLCVCVCVCVRVKREGLRTVLVKDVGLRSSREQRFGDGKPSRHIARAVYGWLRAAAAAGLGHRRVVVGRAGAFARVAHRVVEWRPALLVGRVGPHAELEQRIDSASASVHRSDRKRRALVRVAPTGVVEMCARTSEHAQHARVPERGDVGSERPAVAVARVRLQASIQELRCDLGAILVDALGIRDLRVEAADEQRVAAVIVAVARLVLKVLARRRVHLRELEPVLHARHVRDVRRLVQG